MLLSQITRLCGSKGLDPMDLGKISVYLKSYGQITNNVRSTMQHILFKAISEFPL